MFFAWKVFLDRLPTRSNLQHRGVLVLSFMSLAPLLRRFLALVSSVQIGTGYRQAPSMPPGEIYHGRPLFNVDWLIGFQFHILSSKSYRLCWKDSVGGGLATCEGSKPVEQQVSVVGVPVCGEAGIAVRLLCLEFRIGVRGASPVPDGSRPGLDLGYRGSAGGPVAAPDVGVSLPLRWKGLCPQ
ncbi:hypothetical protein Tco_0724300 [Tanacetum coccineum]